jgi:hypothetical protein
MLGSSVLCSEGAEGPFPNQCNNGCPTYAYEAQVNGSAIWCLPFNNVNENGSIYTNTYLYAYNDVNYFVQLLSTSKTLTLESSGEYSYPISPGDQLTFANLPSFYKIIISLKYRSQTPVRLNISATT